MNIVTGIREYRGVIEVSVDGSAAMRVRKQHFLKRPVAEGEEIDMEDYANAIASIQFADAYEAALTSLDFSSRTAKELERSLLTKGYVPQVIEAVLTRLTENKLVDDRRLATRIAESSASKPVGVYALKRKLRAKGISDEDACEALEALDDEQQQQAAVQAGEKLCRRYGALPHREACGKLSQALARRGFGWDAVHFAVEQLLGDDELE